MRKLILTILILIFAISINAQINYYTVEPGQYVIYNVGAGDSITVDRKDTRGGVIAYRNHVAVVDTIFKVPATASNDTIVTLMTAANNTGKAAILFERGSTRRTAITVSQDSLLFGAYGTGDNPVIDGADVLTGFTDTVTDSIRIEYINDGDFESFTNTTEMISIFAKTASDETSTWALNETNAISGENDGILAVTSVGTSTLRPSIGVTLSSARVLNERRKLTFKYKVNSGTVKLSRYYNGVGSVVATTTLTGTGTHTIYYTSAGTSTLQSLYFDGRNVFNVQIDDISDEKIIPPFTLSENVWIKTNVTIIPNATWFNDTVVTAAADTASLNVEGEWYLDDITKILFVYSATDPSGKVEIGQRKAIVNLGNKDYITLKNLTVQHSNEANNPSIGIDNNSGGIAASGDFLTITGCTIQDNGFHGLFVSNGSHIIIDNNTFLRNGESYTQGDNIRIYATTPGTSNITFTNNQSNYAGQDGFRIFADTKANHITNVTIHSNTFNNNNAAGLYVQKLDSAVIYNNIYDSNGDPVDTSEDYGIGITSCDNLDVYNNTLTNTIGNDALQLYADSTARWGSSHNVRIFNNYISGAISGDGIAVGAHGGKTTENLQIFYNVVALADQYGINFFVPANGSAASSVNIFNNTVYGCGTGGTGFGGIFVSDNAPAVIRNNILNNWGSAQEIKSPYSTSSLTTSNNLYHTNGNAARYNNRYYSMAQVTDFEPTAITGDPLFTDAANGDFTLQSGSPAVNAGTNIGLTHDILGNPIVGLPDIGAYEKQ